MKISQVKKNFRIGTEIEHRTHFSDQQMAVLKICETQETANHLTLSDLLPYPAAAEVHTTEIEWAVWELGGS